MPAVALFDPCYMSVLRPDDAGHARRVLEALGDEVKLIDGRCCGQPAFNSGFTADARTVGRGLLRAAQPHEVVVVASGSCTAMVQNHLPGLFPGTRSSAAAKIGSRFREFGDYVANHPAVDNLELKLEGVVTYHDACHARRELDVSKYALDLLSRVDGLELRRIAHEDECCGFGGSFSVKLPEVSAAMMRAKLDDVRATGAQVLISGDLSCLAHLEAGARGLGMTLETWTLAELLSRALA